MADSHEPTTRRRWMIGDLVQMFVASDHRGSILYYGVVSRASAYTVSVKWEDGLTYRYDQSEQRLYRALDVDEARLATQDILV